MIENSIKEYDIHIYYTIDWRNLGLLPHYFKLLLIGKVFKSAS